MVASGIGENRALCDSTHVIVSQSAAMVSTAVELFNFKYLDYVKMWYPRFIYEL